MNNFLNISIFFNIFILLHCTLGLERTKLMPNLPAGKYKLKFKAAFSCNKSIDYLINIDFHLSKASPTITLLTGTATFKIPFDDSLYYNINMAIWSKIGGWKDNAFVYKNKGACSMLKFFFGNTWKHLVQAEDCPVQAGTYHLKGYDLSLISQANFPKEFFYGTYKYKLFYTDDKFVEVGCFFIIFDLLRPWE
ncbi:uncharacterized protein LOC126899487 [Daktulosphaira vitifoliae]|uniref:uncharacterized protein LOC126899487 n=1 Tax=Daktulosphaira vitifoliae TaxID=58002 RepID=UPI0021AA4794|nr:uncharacterized protein LOC126899487 [Daktulosphaira vitifoliae]